MKILSIIILAGILAGCTLKDDSDPPNGISGLTVYTDNATGCQYISSNGNPMMPRIDSDGVTHRGCRKTAP